MLLVEPAARPTITEILDYEPLSRVFPAYFVDLYGFLVSFNALPTITLQLAYTIDQLPLLLSLPEDVCLSLTSRSRTMGMLIDYRGRVRFQGFYIVLPYIKQFFSIKSTRFAATTVLFEPLAKSLGCHAEAHLLTTILSLYEVRITSLAHFSQPTDINV